MCTGVEGSDVDELFSWTGHGGERRRVTRTGLATSFASAVAHRRRTVAHCRRQYGFRSHLFLSECVCGSSEATRL